MDPFACLACRNTAVALAHRRLQRPRHAVVTADLTTPARPARSRGAAFVGGIEKGAFDGRGELACEWWCLPANLNGQPDSDVLKPWANGMGVTRRPRDKWVIDFGRRMNDAAAALYRSAVRPCRGTREARARRRAPRSRRQRWASPCPCRCGRWGGPFRWFLRRGYCRAGPSSASPYSFVRAMASSLFIALLRRRRFGKALIACILRGRGDSMEARSTTATGSACLSPRLRTLRRPRRRSPYDGDGVPDSQEYARRCRQGSRGDAFIRAF